ncbi:hypothetical protein H696_05116 [Fonticula alba]|uniref:AP complex subunit sigma n=1 Tax=Fonticula alba TaxID=691883 RepID=A0A058Z3T5_FONAL|nr:hypothetical protein H696_05116 [Fonticula alba]KCV68187.1 hypothetical protein H696_05116 [Fonticula alba]|eukprot:XP_009497241.1 hypothetical protein H696_05116 [Fonticula alba]
MIKTVLIINNQGKPRLTKFYSRGGPGGGQRPDEATQQRIIREIAQLVTRRPDSMCNFLEGSKMLGGPDSKIIYRHYATLYFVFEVDSSESELGILDLIHVFVETMDYAFKSVREIDIIFHSDKVHYILDEIIMGGMVLETNVREIIGALEASVRLEREQKELSNKALASGRNHGSGRSPSVR